MQISPFIIERNRSQFCKNKIRRVIIVTFFFNTKFINVSTEIRHSYNFTHVRNVHVANAKWGAFEGIRIFRNPRFLLRIV